MVATLLALGLPVCPSANMLACPPAHLHGLRRSASVPAARAVGRARTARMVASLPEEAPDETPEEAADETTQLQEFCFGLPGAIAPAGEFDPAGLLRDRPKAEVYRWRESELTHGRVAMLASAGFLVQPFFHPLGESLPALQQIVAFPQNLLFAVPTVIGFVETARSQRWTGNEVIRNVLPRSEDGRYMGASGVGAQGLDTGDVGYYPGDVGFDPLGLLPMDQAELRVMQVKKTPNPNPDPNLGPGRNPNPIPNPNPNPNPLILTLTLQDKELAHGRLAMLAAAGFVAQEAATGMTWPAVFSGTVSP